MKRSLILILVLLTLASCTTSPTGQVVTDNEISIRLPTPFADAMQTPLFVALEEGYFTDEGLNVKINMGSRELNPVKMVATGTDEFGILGGPDTLLVARSRGHDLVAVMVLHKESNFPVLVTLKESGITKVEQLEGEKVAFFYGHISTDVLRNTFRKTKTKITEVDIGNYDYTQLITGKVKAQYGWENLAPYTFAKKGIDINIISPKDYGITSHGYTFFTTRTMIENNPETVQKIVKAVSKGLKYTIENPKTAVKDSLALHNVNSDIDTEIERLNVINEFVSTEPFGYMDEQMFQETYDRLLEEGVLESEFDVKEVFTTEFLQ